MSIERNDLQEIAERDRQRFIEQLQRLDVRIVQDASWDEVHNVLDDRTLLKRTARRMKANPEKTSWNDLFAMQQTRERCSLE